jgi:phosphoribosylformylglycinamidine synthase subunit PurL
LDPRLAGAAAMLEGAMNVACAGARPIGITNCLNFGSPEVPEGYWQLSEAVAGMADACRTLGIPIVSGNVSLYNHTPDGPILPTPVIGTVGLLDDRSTAVPMAWRAGDQLWLLGEAAADPSALAGSELAWQRNRTGGAPQLDTQVVARMVALLVRLCSERLLAAAHDLSVGGLGVALARMAMAAGCGASVRLPAGGEQTPTAALFGERVGRALVAIAASDASRLAASCTESGVDCVRLGAAGGDELAMEVGGTEIRLPVGSLASAWETPF